jgi:hypothetical protein
MTLCVRYADSSRGTKTTSQSVRASVTCFTQQNETKIYKGDPPNEDGRSLSPSVPTTRTESRSYVRNAAPSCDITTYVG